MTFGIAALACGSLAMTLRVNFMFYLSSSLVIFSFFFSPSSASAQMPDISQYAEIFTPERIECLGAATPLAEETPSIEQLQRWFACFRGTPLGAAEGFFGEETIACIKNAIGTARFEAFLQGTTELTTAEDDSFAKCFSGSAASINAALPENFLPSPYFNEILSEEQINEIAGANFIRPFLKPIRAIIDNPRLEKINEKTLAPIAAAAVAANAAAAIPLSGFITYFRFLLSQPLLLLEKRKRKGWGVVYNAFSKTPIDLAIVRLVDSKTKKIHRTRVTDAHGRYAFIAAEGDYNLQVEKPKFRFPSAELAAAKTDEPYQEIYHGENISVSASGDTIRGNIPLDPAEAEPTPRQIIRQKIMAKVNRGVAASSPIFAVASFIISPKPTIATLAIFHIALYALMRRLALKKRPKEYGAVKETESGQPIAQAVVRVFRADFNKLAETQITDKHGRYAFLIGPGVFYFTAEKPGYRKFQSPPYDYRKSGAEAFAAFEIKLTKEK